MKTFAFVFARSGSKGLPGKNIRQLVNKPLLGHALSISGQTPEIDRYFVSTDSTEIADVAESYGATVIERPAELAQDDSPEWFAWRHAIEWVRAYVSDFDRFISLPATAPMRLVDDVRLCLDALDDLTDFVVTMTPAQRSPWFNMVKLDNAGHLSILVETDSKIIRRQDTPQAFDLTTVAYVSRPEFIMNHNSLWQGRVRGVLIPQERALDIDTDYDFKIAEYLMKERLARADREC